MQMRAALLRQFGRDAPRVQQFHAVREAITPARDGMNFYAGGPQALHALPDRGTGLGQLLRQPLAGMQLTVRQQHQQGRAFYTVRGRNNHSRRTRFSLPARMRAILLRWVKMTKTATAAQKVQSERLLGRSRTTATASTTVAIMVARPT